MIKVTKETIEGYGSIISNHKTKSAEEELNEIQAENAFFLADSIRVASVSEPGFMAGWALAYCTIKRQIENDELS
tara:strand:+ start:1537 stop:1761 length:225 start_codon:yes stop_codon:yes gene_type:complete